ncbi:Ig-like domain-containing protein [Thomasclavelia cocleata]|uniref:Ig-like domain-containing protein n=5 Tax=Thomasclavelia cocleata TaxID=69824 RepID=UPI0025AC0FAE|nr:Ig-like domain-containing protein [Thomasclavelia cocleata]
MCHKLKSMIIIVLASVLITGSFLTAPVKAQDCELDSNLIEEHSGGLADYTQMYGLNKTQSEPVSYNKYLRSSATQENSYIAILVEFPDKTTTSLDSQQTLSKAEAIMNTGNGSMETSEGKVSITSLKQYVEKYTYNKMTTTTRFFPQNSNGKVVSVMLSKNRSYYMKKSSDNPEGYYAYQAVEREKELVNEILNKSKESIERVLSANDLDKNNDGNVDAVSFFIEADKATEDKVEWSDLLWSHKISGMNLNVNLHGKKVDTYNLINTYDSNYEYGVFSLNQGTYGTVIHEYMHILGLPDLYRYNDDGDPVGFYDVMAKTTSYNPQGILAYMTSDYNNLGWNNKLSEITASATITLNRPQYSSPGEKRAVKIRSPLNKDEFFVAEFYEKRTGVDASETSTRDGLVVYRINSRVKDGNVSGTGNGLKDYLYVFRPNENELGKGKGNLNEAVMNKSNRSTFGKMFDSGGRWDNNTLFYSDGSNSGIIINIIESSNNSITLKVTVPAKQGTGINSVSLDKKALTLTVNQTSILQATIEPYNTTDDKTLTWTSSDPKVATVDNNGKVTGIAAGTATITVRTGNGKTASCNVTVIKQNPSVNYQTHVQDYGWQDSVKDGQEAGTIDQSKRLEAIKISISNNSSYTGSIQYQTHIQDIGWQEWKGNGILSGTESQSKRLEAIRIKLTGDLEKDYDIYYQVHAQEFGWLDWAKNGEPAGTAGYSYRLEAIKIKLVQKDKAAPGETKKPYIQRYVSYATHIQDIGWQTAKYDGEMSGTSGKSKRLEAINISLSNQQYSGSVEYSTHVEDYGWQGWKRNGETAGTAGKSKRLEAIQIKLTGEMANYYDIYYRVHVQDYGWLGWAKNGGKAGSEGMSKRLEGIEIVLVTKGGMAPGSTSSSFIKK